MNAYKLYRFIKSKKNSMLGLWISFTTAILLENLTGSDTFSDFIDSMLDFAKPSIFLMYVFSVVVVLMFLVYFITKIFVKGQRVSAMFTKIMNDHTFEILQSDGSVRNELSWGYNKNLYRSKEPTGWRADEFIISSYDNAQTFRLPKTNTALEGYTQSDYYKFCQSEQIKNCIRNRNDMERYAVISIHPNFNRKERRVQLSIIKTKWSVLLFHWDYFRLLDQRNSPVLKSDAVLSEYKKAFADDSYLINSFCLHLILEDKNGNAILARISKKKSNDYPATWAATIGEQLSLEDFYEQSNNSVKDDFVVRWAKRALSEEFDISESESVDIDDELEEYVDMQSLRILSIDMEADIYNIAITCVIKLRIQTDEFAAIKGISIDSDEISELKQVNEDSIREILLDYPNNQHEYHPSTYLRLLMFHVYKRGVKDTGTLICKDYMERKRRNV